jgi:hypothetical protein
VATLQCIGCRLLVDSRRHQLDVSDSRIRCRFHARRRRHGFQQARHLLGKLTSDSSHRAGPNSCTRTRTGARSASADDHDNTDDPDNIDHHDDTDDNDDTRTHAAGFGDGWVQWGFRVW